MDRSIPYEAPREMIRVVLERAHAFDWTVQGFGFIRTYFGGKRFRLNVWNSALKCNASTIHDHPWDFRSWIISGQFDNLRYRIVSPRVLTHHWMWLRTGVGGGPEQATVSSVELEPMLLEEYKAGDTYCQAAHQIHDSLYHDGAVTLNERRGDTERARVFWPYGQEWQDAMPRVARPYEISRACEQALSLWES